MACHTCHRIGEFILQMTVELCVQGNQVDLSGSDIGVFEWWLLTSEFLLNCKLRSLSWRKLIKNQDPSPSTGNEPLSRD